ncbi:MAG: 6-carboxytetrahydropterin synthase [Candidatus Latescibacteria bacterium]|jgi:6-pyruvoyltetrahydropterin/6-carboxytetrahydropterin synthase|nr:6-carboxytetrahydropterin synthase [Candidatus Latescibacterota bacterium]
MSQVQAIRRIQFCSGHRVLGHEGKCAHMHGHNYVVFFHAEADDLDQIGRVIDFSVLKEKLGGWVEDNWDHGFVFFEKDEELRSLFEGQMAAHKHFVLPLNPTAENMGDYLLNTVGPEQLKGTGVQLVKVAVWETENCIAEVTL